MSFEVDDCLRYVVEREGSDLHLKVNAPPMARIHGTLRPLEDHERLDAADTEAALRTLISDDRTREEFAADGEADFSYELKGISRFRVNAFRQRGAVSIVCRAIPFQVRTIEDLGLPPVIRKLADEQRGIILLTGTTGSGKSTTLAAMIDHINSTYPHHVITLEDPIEYLHRDKRAIINQREVGSDTKSFSRAMKRILRQDPDVILVGEMRDEETVRTALSAAETGHLVLSTLHTLDATETINRIIDFFPPHLQQQARVMLASTLKGAVSQRLVPTADGVGRVAASEILVVTGRVQDLILNPKETGKISQVIAEGEYYGMQTFDQSLLSHVQEGRVSEKTAMEFASSPHDFKLMLASSGKRASDLSQLLEEEDDGSAGDGGEYAGDGLDELGAEPVPAPDSAQPAPEPAASAPEPPAADSNGAGAPAADPGSVEVEYGSPEHAYGRSVTPKRPAPEASPEQASPEPEAADAVEEDVEYGGETALPVPEGEDGGDAADGLGSPEYAAIWGQSDSSEGDRVEAAIPPPPDTASSSPAEPQGPAQDPSRPTEREDRLAEFRPPNFPRD